MFFLEVLSAGFKSGPRWCRVEQEQAIKKEKFTFWACSNFFVNGLKSVESSYQKNNLFIIFGQKIY